MTADLPAELIDSFITAAREAAAARRWDDVLDLAEDALVLDRDNREALTLRTLAERHVGQGHPSWGRRHETVLFADLVASTALANRFDPEVVRRTIRDFELACTPVLTALGGHVHRFVGDGILASFGYPTSHEDDARRAVQAGLDLVRAVASTARNHGAVGAELQVRVGIASGVLVHGDRGAGSWTQPGDLFGPAVNLAARLHEVAEPGQVCISDETKSLVAGFFEVEDLGARELKGFGTPVVAHRVLRSTGATGWTDRSDANISPFVGRDDELACLIAQWERVTDRSFGGADGDGTPSASVFVSGEPGVGKSRILREFLDATASADRTVVELQCAAYRTASPLHPVRAAIERRCAFTPDDDDATRFAKLTSVLESSSLDTAEAVPYLALLLEIELPDGVERPELSPIQLREVTLGHLHRWIVGAATRRPSVLVVEDLHWADPSTRELLQRITATPPARLLTIVTSRTPPVWAVNSGFEMLTLVPLSQEEARKLAAAVAEGELAPGVVEEIARRSDGIPLFVEQLADSMSRPDEHHLGPNGTIPLRLGELLQARLDATGSSKRVAQLAATVGREFEPKLVEALAQILQHDGQLEHFDRPVNDHLDRLVDSNLVEPDPTDAHRLRFRHALVRDEAYESQLLEERPERHHALARLMLHPASRAPDAAVVAHHFELADRPYEAIAQYLEAAASGQAAGAFAEATANLGRAEAMLPLVAESARPALELAVRLNRGLAVSSVAGYAAPQVIDDFARAAELCAVLQDVRELAAGVLQALLGSWTYYCATGDLARAASLSTSMEQQLDRVRMPGGRPSFEACRGVEHFFTGSLDRAEEHLETAVALFATDDIDQAEWPLPNDPLAAALAFLAPLRLIRGDERGALAAADAGVERSRDLAFPRGPFSLAFVRMYESWLHRMLGDGDSARAAAEEVLRIGERHGFFDWVMTGRIHLAAAAIADEPSLAVLDEMGDAIALWRSVGGRIGLPLLLVEQGWAYLALGERERAASCLADAEDVAGRYQRFAFAELHRLRAELFAASNGKHDPAIAEELLAGMRLAERQGAHLFVVRCGDAYVRRLGADRLEPGMRRSLAAARAVFDSDVLVRAEGFGRSVID
jgi:class 3 adenylate cyclase/tetratricopeptide (TPR) repeat protein